MRLEAEKRAGCRLRPDATALLALLALVSWARAGLALDGGAVATESPIAAEIGAAVLAEGGSAVDAAVATSLAMCVASPSSCGIGGGGFMVIFDPAARRAHALDYREVAPTAARPDRFAGAAGVYDPQRSRRGGLAVAVPGELRGLAEAHRRFGRLPWSRLVEPSVRLAREGFPISAHLALQIAANADAIAADAELAAILLDAQGRPRAAGETLSNPALASTLAAVGAAGPRAFYEGAMAEAIVAAVAMRGGMLTGADLAAYRPLWRKPLEVAYRGAIVHTMPPPSGGGPALVLALRTLGRYDVAALGADSPTRFHLFAEILKHAFAERARSAGDPAFDAPPRVAPGGIPSGRLAASRTFPPDHYGSLVAAASDGGTAQVSVVSPDGGAVACTTTINTAFGAMVGVPGTGIALNNEIDDFSFDAPNVYGLEPGRTNRIAAGKRPASSMTPTVAVESGRAVVAVGASGGPFIVSATLQVLSNVLDFGMPPEAAVAAPRIHHQWQPEVLLVEPAVREIDRAALSALGHPIRQTPAVAAVSLATASPAHGARAAGDPRKGGGASFVHDGDGGERRGTTPRHARHP